MPRLLVVDDEPTYCEELRALLAGEGHEVETAVHTEAAIEISRRFPPDVLVVDWMLRDPHSGLELAKLLREFNPNLKIIIISGYLSNVLKARAADAEVVEFLEKPFDPGELCDAVRRVVAG